VLLDTADYNWKIAVLLEDEAYMESKQKPTESMVCKTFLLMMEFSVSIEVCQQLQLQVPGP
jgi:hypothetical protein